MKNPSLEQPHRRFNALTGEWVFVSPQRTQRPWQGAVEAAQVAAQPPNDPNCYLCPGNRRANGERNPEYQSTFVFTNDFPAFKSHVQPADDAARRHQPHALLRASPQLGTCRVVCFSPHHDLSLANLPASQIRAVVRTWIDEVSALSQQWQWVQVFENKGALVGASNPHPHGQIWAGDFMPTEVKKESACQRRWRNGHPEPLLLHYAQLESAAHTRTVIESEHWIIVVPWWALWPFETLLLPRREVRTLPELTPPEADDLAQVLKRLMQGYDALFAAPFPYSMGWHGAPRGAGAASGWQLHAHVFPPLLRSATVRKFMVGYEMFAEGQRDLTPEEAAARLQNAVLSASQPQRSHPG